MPTIDIAQRPYKVCMPVQGMFQAVVKSATEQEAIRLLDRTEDLVLDPQSQDFEEYQVDVEYWIVNPKGEGFLCKPHESKNEEDQGKLLVHMPFFAVIEFRITAQSEEDAVLGAAGSDMWLQILSSNKEIGATMLDFEFYPDEEECEVYEEV